MAPDADKTSTKNADNEFWSCPSLTVIVIDWCRPTSPAPGGPVTEPVPESNMPLTRRFWIEKVSGSPSASLAVGVNEYGWPSVTVFDGVPEITGAVLTGGLGGGGGGFAIGSIFQQWWGKKNGAALAITVAEIKTGQGAISDRLDRMDGRIDLALKGS